MTTVTVIESAETCDMEEEIFKYIQSNDLQSLEQVLDCIVEDTSNTEELQRENLLGKKDEAGRNALLTASMLGRSAIVRELVKYGAQVNDRTVRGYTALHLAAGWGHLDTVRTLLELGADTDAKTFQGVRPVDLARRYSKTDCADCLMQAYEDELSNLKNQNDVSKEELVSETTEEGKQISCQN